MTHGIQSTKESDWEKFKEYAGLNITPQQWRSIGKCAVGAAIVGAAFLGIGDALSASERANCYQQALATGIESRQCANTMGEDSSVNPAAFMFDCSLLAGGYKFIEVIWENHLASE